MNHRRRTNWANLLPALTALLAALLIALPAPLAAASVDLRIGRLARQGWLIEDIRGTYGTGEGNGGLSLRIARVEPPTGDAITNIRLDCPGLSLQAKRLRCRDDAASANLPHLGDQTVSVALSYDRATRTVSARISGVTVAQGRVSAELEWHRGDWRGHLEADTVDLSAVTAMASSYMPSDWSASGRISASVTVSGSGQQPQRGITSLEATDAGFSGPTGLRAGEGLAAHLDWRARRQNGDWVGQAELTASDGQLYIDPVFTDFGAHPLKLTGDAVARAQAGIVELLGFDLAQSGVMTVSGDASLSREPPYLLRAQFQDLVARLPAAYTTYAKPFLRGTVGADLNPEGAIAARGTVRDGGLTSLQVTPNAVTIRDGAGRFELTRISGDIAWQPAASDANRVSRLAWQGGSIYGVGIGAAGLTARMSGDSVHLTSPATIPVLDGSLLVNELAISDITAAQREGQLDARLKPISMSALTQALGWPQFSGTLAGRLPSLTYQQGVATLGGKLQARAFGGEITARELSLRDPLGSLPELTADIAIDGLDLETLTGTFEFGRITGSLDGTIENLRLLGWRPANFRAWFSNPADDPRPHRISQRAVENLADLGGAGGAAALSRGFLQFFDDFKYQRLGVGCILREDVCVMRGIADAGNGYYIVRGSGVPRVEVIGFVNTVSWPTLVEQILSATASGGPVVK